MKKVFALFMTFLVCLACFNSMVGAHNRKYKDTVVAVVSVINGIGNISHAMIDIILPGGADISAIKDLPEYYQDLYQAYIAAHGCNGACSTELEYYIRNICYSDAKAYYLDECTYMQSVKYESQVLDLYFPWFVNKKEAVQPMYEAGVLGGYPMNNPALCGPGLYSSDFIDFVCPYSKE